jgi:DNA-binding transcriptional regulator YiaG
VTENQHRNEEGISLDALLAAAAYQPPSLENDPAAKLLGLVPNSHRSLSPSALKKARMRAGLKTSELAQRLVSKGWHVRASDVLGWETKSSRTVPPALIAAIALEIAVDEETLVVLATDDYLQEVRLSSAFKQLARRWATLKSITIEAAMASLEQQTLTTVHRGGPPDTARLLATIAALVEAAESRGQ